MGRNGRNSTQKNALKRKLLKGAKRGRCVSCEEMFDADELTLDHIIPQSHGGSWHIKNLQLMCERCNRAKGSSCSIFDKLETIHRELHLGDTERTSGDDAGSGKRARIRNQEPEERTCFTPWLAWHCCFTPCGPAPDTTPKRKARTCRHTS